MQNTRPNFGPAYGQGVPGGQPRPRGGQPGAGPMIPSLNPGQNSAQDTARLHAAAEAALRKREDAKRRSQKPVDRALPAEIEEYVLGDGVERYKAMREAERRLDAAMMRKRLDVVEGVHRDAKRYGTLRVWVSNSCKNQGWQYDGLRGEAFDFNSGIEPTFRVKIEGRLLDDEAEKEEEGEQKAEEDQKNDATGDAENEDEGERAAKRQKMSPSTTAAGASRKQLSHFFRHISIDFDRPAKFQPDNYTRIEWKRPDTAVAAAAGGAQVESNEADFDRLEFERKADENINLTINLVKDEEIYRLDRPLAELLDMEEADRQTVLMGIWEYIKLAGVRMDDDKRQLYPDQRLRTIFKQESIYFPHLPQLIQEHLYDPPPLQLQYTIRVDKAFHSLPEAQKATIYDIRVPLPPASPARNLPLDIEALKKITATDDTLALLVAKLNQSAAKRNFLDSLSKDPASFIKRWVSSQQRDLDVILGKGAWGGMASGEDEILGAEWRKGGMGGVWGSREAWEGVGSYLGRAGGR